MNHPFLSKEKILLPVTALVILMLVIFAKGREVKKYFSPIVNEESTVWTTDPDTLVTLRIPKDKNKKFKEISFLGTVDHNLEERIKAASPERIVLAVGDSNLFNSYTSENTTFPELLEKTINRKSPKKFVVVNGGVVGYGPDQNFLRAVKLYSKLKYSYLVFHVFSGNDLGDLIRNKLLLPDGHAFKFKTYPDYKDLNFTMTPFDKTLTRLKWQMNPLTIETLLNQNKEEVQNYKSDEEPVSVFLDHYDLDVASDPQSPDSLLKLQLLSEVFRRLRTFSLENKIKTIVLIEPAKPDLVPNIAFNFEEFARFKNYRPSNLTSLIENSAHANALPVVNLFDEYNAVADKTALFMTEVYDDHWKDQGVSIAVDKTYPLILFPLKR